MTCKIPEREKEGEEQLTSCSSCLNLKPDNWCSAKKRTVPGTRHLRKCDLFQQGTPNPAPARPGKPQHPDLVQCVSCVYFAGWGLCEAGYGEISGEIGSRIWRWCSSHYPAEPTGACSECRYLVKQVCAISSFPVTCSDQPTSCRKCLSLNENQSHKSKGLSVVQSCLTIYQFKAGFITEKYDAGLPDDSLDWSPPSKHRF